MYYTRYAIVYTFTKLHDRRIPNVGVGVRVGVGPVEFQLNRVPYIYLCLLVQDKKHLKNVVPIRHSEPPHAALPFTRCRYCRIARRLRIDVHDDDDDNDNAWQMGPL